MAKVKRKIPLLLRIAIGVVLAMLALAAAGVALRYWITSDPGRAFLVSQIDGRRIGPLGVIRISGLKGDPLGAATLADIALVDDDGVWLRARDARVEWTPEKLFSGDLEIRAVQIRVVDMLRLPHTTYQSENRPPPDIGLKLDEVIIEELKIADNVLGPTAASYRVNGGAARGRDGAGFAKLSVAPLTGPADRVDASAQWTAAGALDGMATVAGPAGGIVAALLQAPENTPVAFSANVDGTVTQFNGTARLVFADESVALIDLSRAGDVVRLSASISAERWPLLAAVADRTGGGVTLEGEANLADAAKAPVSLRLNAPAGRIDAHAVFDIDESRLVEGIDLDATGLDLAFVAPPLKGKVNADGTLRLIGLTDFVWQGNAVATRLEYPSGAIDRVATPLTIRKDRSSIFWEAPSAIVDGGRVTSLKSLAPARYSVATRGEVNLATRMVELSQAQVEGAPGQVTARGTYAIRTGAFEYSGAASFLRLSDVAPLTGSARGQWNVKRSSHDAPIRISADATGRQVSSRIETLAQLSGPSPAVKITGVVRNGRFVLESGSFRGEGLNAAMTGRITDNGVVTGRATGSLSRPLDVPGATIASLAFVADVSGRLAAPRIDTRLSDGSVSVAGVTIDRIVGEAQASLGDKIAGDFSLSGGSEGQPMVAAGRLEGGGGDWRIVNLNARLGGLQIRAPKLAYADGVFDASFDANGSLVGISGLTRGTLAATGTVSVGDDLKLDVTGQLANLRRDQMRIELVAFEARAADDTATLKGRLKGTLGAPVDIAFNANGRNTAEAWTGTATLEGTVDQLPVATSRPANWSYGEAGWSVDTQLAAFGGQFNATVKSGFEGASANLDLANVDLRALSRLARISPMDGRVTGQARFSNGPAPAVGDLQLGISGANPVGVTADPVMVSLTSRLREGVLTTIATGAGQGFKLEAGSRVQVLVGEGFNVVPDRDAPLEAQLTLDGRAEQMWSLFGPEDQVLRGAINADVRVAGSLDSPTLSGGFGIADGAYEHSETGLRLADISGKGVFDQRSARITEVSANDGNGGRLSAEGRIDWEDGFDGGVQFTATNLRALGRDDRTAVVSGQGAVTLDTDSIRVTGDLTVNQARISIEQPASASIPTLPGLRRVNFPNQEETSSSSETAFWQRLVQLDLQVKAPRRVVVFGRGLDTEWSVDMHVQGPISNPEIKGTATLIRGDLDLAGRRFAFDTGSITLDGPIRTARIDISAERSAEDIDARVHVTGSPTEPKFALESTPALPQDEILSRVLFGRSASELSAFEAAQLAAGLTQLAGGQAGFDPVGLVRQATGLDRVAVGASGGVATVQAGKYIADDVYLQVGAGGEGGVAAEVEWEPRDNLSIISSAQGNGDTKIAVRWKNDY
ncbi:MAG: translocation/assembly module TamB domain-containing protein [Hyphomonadaceae bacterium]|nr:translocation/assembly module TamB domain-containing protein [Hyphomonadaceae bacterium]